MEPAESLDSASLLSRSGGQSSRRRPGLTSAAVHLRQVAPAPKIVLPASGESSVVAALPGGGLGVQADDGSTYVFSATS